MAAMTDRRHSDRREPVEIDCRFQPLPVVRLNYSKPPAPGTVVCSRIGCYALSIRTTANCTFKDAP